MATTLTQTHPLLSVPFNAATDFTVLADHCDRFAETLLESDDPTLRLALCGRLVACLSLLRPTLNDPIPLHLIESLTVDVRERLAQGITKRSLQNEMAAVRCILKQAGRDRLAQSERLNNRSLGLSGASRNGTRRAITQEHYRDVLETARVKAPGLAAALELSRLMGLRSQEAVQSENVAAGAGARRYPVNRGVWHQRRATP